MPLSNVPVYENHVQTAVGELPPYIYHTPNPVPELISPRNFSCHWHEGVEILTMVEGTAQIMCDSVLHTVSPGETVVIHANQLHTVDSPSPGCRYHCLILERDFCAARGIDILAARWTPQFTDPALAALMDELLRETESGAPYTALRQESIVLRYAAELCTRHRLPDGAVAAAADRTIELVKQTLLFLNEHYREPLSLAQICKAIGFSKYYLCRTFRSVIGQTVLDYINLRRCQSAQSLLRRGIYNVTECAALCGFSSASYFTRQYQKIIGELPSATRRSARGRSGT